MVAVQDSDDCNFAKSWINIEIIIQMAKKDIYVCENEYGKKTEGVACKHAVAAEELSFDHEEIDPLCPNEECQQPLIKIRTEGSSGVGAKKGVFAVLALVIVGVLIWGGYALIAGGAGKIKGVPKIVNFGDVSPNQTYQRVFSVSNRGKGVLRISKINCNNPDFSIDPTSIEIEPGDKSRITISFTPKKQGTVASQLEIQCNDAEYKEVKVDLKSVVTKVNWSSELDGIMKKSSATQPQP